MSNKTELQSNNLDLQDILNTVNALPDKGEGSGGGSFGTCAVKIFSEIHYEASYTAVTQYGKPMLTFAMGTDGDDYAVVKETILVVTDAVGGIAGGNLDVDVNTTGDLAMLMSNGEQWAFEVYGDGTITIDVLPITGGGAG